MLNLLTTLSSFLQQGGIFFLMFAVFSPSFVFDLFLFCLQRDMLDVNQIMKDLASMVHEQGDTIGEILFMCVHA